ncbi:MAG: polysaccharide biosynthesis tyrosine autokinase, partial [Gammaproteobacteria bacterium]|nr:polysaccharide biosynthesis tyrosine autokinase [Gammaproteobacteria bacterium]
MEQHNIKILQQPNMHHIQGATGLDNLLNQNDWDESDIDFLHYWHIVRRYAKQIIGLMFLAILVGVFTAFSMQPIYTGETSLHVDPLSPKLVAVDPLQNAANTMFFYKTQEEVIRSRSIAEAVIDKLSLQKHPVLVAELSILQQATTEAEEDSSIWWWKESKAQPSEEAKRSELVGYMREHLTVENQRNSEIIRVSFRAPEPKLAADVANAFSTAYINRGLDAHSMVAKQATGWLAARLAELQKNFVQSEEDLRAYQIRESIVDSKSSQSISSGKLQNITTALVDAQAKKAQAETLYLQVRKAEMAGQTYESLQAVLQYPLIQDLSGEQTKLARKVSELSDRYGEKHPKMIAARSDFKEANLKLQQEIGKVVEGIRNDYEAARDNELKLQALHGEIQKEIRAKQGKGNKLAKLEREVQINRELYNVFLTRLKETDVASNAGVTNVQIIDRAIPPMLPSEPKKRRIVLIFTILGLLIGLGLAFLLERLDNTFKTSEDVETKLSLPMLGITPIVKTDTGIPERFIFENNKSTFSEAIGNVRTGVLFSDIDNPPKMILVTSSIANEGKTTLSNNLAISFSHMAKTLLIEADLRKPGQAGILKITSQGGLSELASGEYTLDQCMVQDQESNNLYHITSGTIPPRPLELLSSKKVKELFSKLRQEFEYIVIDTAPVLPVSDSLVLGQLADAVIFSVKADSTTFQMAQEAIKRLRTAGVSPLGVVLTQAHEEKMHSYG